MQLIILFLGTVLGFAEVRPDHPQPTKTTEVRLVYHKMNFDFTLPTQFTNIGVKKNICIQFGCAGKYFV